MEPTKLFGEFSAYHSGWSAGAPISLAQLTWRRFLRHKLALTGGVVLLLLAVSAILAPVIAPYNPNHSDFAAFGAAPSSAHLLGADFAGRDMLSRILYGGRVSLLIGVVSMVTAILVGTVLGSLAGFFGGWVDNAIMRLTDVVLSFPLGWGIVGVWSGLVALIAARVIFLGTRFAGRRWAVVGYV